MLRILIVNTDDPSKKTQKNFSLRVDTDILRSRVRVWVWWSVFRFQGLGFPENTEPASA